MSVRLAVLIAMLLVAAPGAAGAAAKPRWSAPQPLDAGPPHRSTPETESLVLAGNARGDRIAAWTVRNGIMISSSRSGHRFAKPRLIPTAWEPTGWLQAGVDRRGRAAIIWTASDGQSPGGGHGDFGCCIRVEGVVVRPGSPLPTARTLSPRHDDAVGPRLAVSASGRIGVTWSHSTRVQARFGSTGRGFGRLENVAEGHPIGVVLGTRRQRVAVQEGDATLAEYVRRRAGSYRRASAVAWDGFSFGSDARGREVLLRSEQALDGSGFMELGTRSPGAALRRHELARHAGPGGYVPRLDVAPSGAAAIAWANEGRPGEPRLRLVHALVRGPRGAFTEPRVIYRAPPAPESFDAAVVLHDVAAAPGGGAAVGVVPTAPSAPARVVLLGRRGRMRAAHAIPTGHHVQRMQVVADARGSAVAWMTQRGLYVAATR